MIIKLIKKHQENLYYIGRLFAIFIIGPLLINRGYKYKDNILILLGICLIIWDGIKVYLQIREN